jgi:aminopeptidase N
MPRFYFALILALTFSFTQAQSVEHACAHGKKAAFQAQFKSTHKDLSETFAYDMNYVKLDLTLDNLTTQIDQGHATLKATVVVQSLNAFVCELHENLVVDSAKVNGDLVFFTRNASELKLLLVNNVSNGNQVLVDIYYHGNPPAANAFFGGIFNAVSPSWGARVTWTLSQPFSAFTWWPSKQDLNDKIDSSAVWLTVPNAMKGGSNGLLQQAVAVGANATRYEWKHQYPIDYYLISLAVGPYIEYNFYADLPNTTEQVFVQNFIYDNPNTLPNFQSDIDETADMIYVLSERYGLYPFREEKYGHCMAPLSGGMEHQTMTTQGFFERSLTAHELGHQWFGDHVTCSSWGHIWVNEGFASYSEYLFEESLSYASAQSAMLSVHGDVMSSAGGSVYVVDQTDENQIFDSRLVYNKGSALVHMVRHWVNDDALFFDALKAYQFNFANSTASAEDFIGVMEDVTGVDFNNFLNHWYYGEGYPTISLKYNESADGLVLSLSQVGSRPTITNFFETYLEVKVVFTDNTEEIYRVRNTFNEQQFLFPSNKTVSTITLDDKNWILNKVGAIEKDANLTFTQTALNDEILEAQFEFYPNPNKGSFQLNNQSLKDAKLTIFSTLGQALQSEALVQGTNYIQTELSAGVYLIEIEAENSKFTQLLLID